MIEDKVKNTSSAYIKVWILEKGMLHMLLIEITVYLSPRPLHEAVRFTQKDRSRSRTQTAAPFERFKI